MLYNWQQKDWPEFRYEREELEESLQKYTEQCGRISGLLEGLGEEVQEDMVLNLMIEEAVRTSSIEGEFLSREEVKSSIKNQLGLNSPKVQVHDRRATGIGELMAKIRFEFQKPLLEETLFNWHEILMQGSEGISLGAWRMGPEAMRIVSGRIDNPTIHFEAPSSIDVPELMSRFLSWFNESPNSLKESPIRSGIAHLYFESIHPFEDGNGRIGRAIADLALAQGAGRFAILSLSQVMEAERTEYYDSLKSAQRDNEITPWLKYFVETVLKAQQQAENDILFVLRKGRFFEKFGSLLNERQEKVVRRMFVAGPGGFEGGMNARKYLALAKSSKATATRDLQELVQIGVFSPVGKGRSTRYELVV